MGSEKWEAIDKIPENDLLYVRVYTTLVTRKKGKPCIPNAGAFYNTPKSSMGGKDLSSDWNQFCSPYDTQARAGLEYRTGTCDFKDPSNFYVVSFLVKSLLDLQDDSGNSLNVRVEHSPRQENFPDELEGNPWNYAHTSIIGDDEERRLKMIPIAKWEIAPPEYNSENDDRVFSY